MTAIHQ